MDEDDEYDDTFDDLLEAADLGDDGEAYHQLWLARNGVERTCFYCKCVFLGMPDHGVCPSCADKVEAGYDLDY